MMPRRAFPSIRESGSQAERPQLKFELVCITTMSRVQMRCGCFQQKKMMSASSGGVDEVWMSQSVAVFSEADTHFGVDIDDADVAGCFSFLQRCEELVLVSAKPFCT
jgi:hypothetical protein